jgi:holo-[acyl-carrier protein] synthase
MVLGIGVDIIEVSRIAESLEKYGDRFRKRIFTEREIQYCNLFKDHENVHYAARFAAKEAFSKAIGTGITQGFKFNEVGVINEETGKPQLELSGTMLERWGNNKLHITLSHTASNAVAIVVIESLDKN